MTWMNSPGFVAQAAHTLAGYAAVTTSKLHWPRQMRWVALGVVGYAALKEFWYDARYEDPKGTLPENLLDFSMYCLGVVLGVVLA